MRSWDWWDQQGGGSGDHWGGYCGGELATGRRPPTRATPPSSRDHQAPQRLSALLLCSSVFCIAHLPLQLASPSDTLTRRGLTGRCCARPRYTHRHDL